MKITRQLEREMDAVIDYVQVLSQRGELERLIGIQEIPEIDPGDPLITGYIFEYALVINKSWDVPVTDIVMPEVPRPPTTEETIMLGRKSFIVNSCIKCHGIDNRGERKENVGKGDWGEIAYAADLTLGSFHFTDQ